MRTAFQLTRASAARPDRPSQAPLMFMNGSGPQASSWLGIRTGAGQSQAVRLGHQLLLVVAGRCQLRSIGILQVPEVITLSWVFAVHRTCRRLKGTPPFPSPPLPSPTPFSSLPPQGSALRFPPVPALFAVFSLSPSCSCSLGHKLKLQLLIP